MECIFFTVKSGFGNLGNSKTNPVRLTVQTYDLVDSKLIKWSNPDPFRIISTTSLFMEYAIHIKLSFGRTVLIIYI